MKLSLLEDGVLDYKGPNKVLATPDGIPYGVINNIKLSSTGSIKMDKKLDDHIKNCPVCHKGTLCDTGELILNSI